MCLATPMAQTTPTNPAPYPLDQSYKQVTDSTVGPDGKTTGGQTIGSQLAPAAKAPSAKGTGANFTM